MKIDKDNKLCIFNNDDEFEAFAINSSPTIHKDTNGVSWFDYGYTDTYNQMCTDKYRFCITDPNSKILKRNGTSIHTMFNPISNLVSKDELILDGIEI